MSSLQILPDEYTYPYNLAVQNDGGVMKAVVVSSVGRGAAIGLTRYFE